MLRGASPVRFLLIIAVAVAALYAVVTYSLYGSLDPCVGLAREVAMQTGREAYQAAVDSGEPGLLPRDRKRIESRAESRVSGGIRSREVSYVDCLRGLVTAKSQGKDAPGVRELLSGDR